MEERKKYKVVGHIPVNVAGRLTYYAYPSDSFIFAAYKAFKLRYCFKAIFITVYNEYKDYCWYNYQKRAR